MSNTNSRAIAASLLSIAFFIVFMSLIIGAFAAVKPKDDDIGIQNTFKLCKILKQNPLVTECETNGWNLSIDLYANYSVYQAQIACEELQMAMVQNLDAWHFHGYRLQIFSPFSGAHPVAICGLPE